MRNRPNQQAGVTLVELVVAIVVIAVGVTAVLNVIGVGSRASVDPQLRIKTTELAQTYMEEIYSAKWDQNQVGGGCVDTASDGSGNCDEGPDAACPAPDGGTNNCGRDGESRAGLNDVDDYDGLCLGTDSGKCAGSCSLSEGGMTGGEGDPLSGDDRYAGFCVIINIVSKAGGDLNGLSGNEVRDAKGVTITVSDPQGNEADFSAYRFNY